jgi:hypothetical protein
VDVDLVVIAAELPKRALMKMLEIPGMVKLRAV